MSPIGYCYTSAPQTLTVMGANFSTSGGVTAYFDNDRSSQWSALDVARGRRRGQALGISAQQHNTHTPLSLLRLLLFAAARNLL